MTHTPTPWSHVPDFHTEPGQQDLERYRLVGGKRPITDGYIILPEDAAFIVKACNSHDKLVEALREAETAIDAIIESGILKHTNSLLKPLLAKTRAALEGLE